MSERVGSGSLRARVCLAAAFAALATRGSAAETWLHPVLPRAAVTVPLPARRGARPVRPGAALPAPFPTALSGDSSFVELTVGERYPVPETPVPGERIDRSLVRLGEGRPMPLTSARPDGAVTRLEATWAGQGLATIAVLLTPEARTVEAAGFDAFLREAGATTALEERVKRKETKKPARTVTVESARAFAAVVPPRRTAASVDPAAATDEPLGLPLEIVASIPPLPLRVGASFPATVLLDGRPFPGAVVRAYVPGSTPAAVVADGQGNVVLPLQAEGRLLLATASVRRMVKADRVRGEAWKKADWEVRRSTLELLVLPKAPIPIPSPTRAPKGKRSTSKPGPR